MQTYLKYIVGIALVVGISTCRKYHDGGYEYNAFKHLEGKWKLKLYEVDSIDSTLLTQGATTIPDYLENFAGFPTVHRGKRREMGLNNHYYYHEVYINNNRRNVISVYKGSDRFDSLGCLSSNSQICQRDVFNPTNEQTFNWKIDKLTKKELILISLSYNYKLVLVK